MTASTTAPASAPSGRADIVVIGAGLAGLAAARTLEGSGADVVVLDAASRVGGRVASDVIDGWTVDVGFQLLNPTYPALRRYIDVAQLRLQPLGVGVVTGIGDGRRVLLADPRRHRGAIAAWPAALRLTSVRELLALARYVARAALLPVHRLERAPDLGWHAALDAAGVDGGLRRHVLEPFLTGTLADADGTTSRRYVDLVLRSFVAAALHNPPGLPVGGMQAFAQAVGAPVAARTHLGVGVRRVTRNGSGWRLATDAGDITSRVVIVATEATAAADLLDRPAPPVRALTTFWHVTTEPAAPPDRAPFLHVDGTGGHRNPAGLVNTAVISRSAPSYVADGTPDGSDLVATTVLGARPEAADPARRQAAALLGSDPRTWRLLATHSIATALPVAASPLQVRAPVDLGDGLVVAGDHRDTPSIQGALVSGRRAAVVALAHLHPKAGPADAR